MVQNLVYNVQFYCSLPIFHIVPHFPSRSTSFPVSKGEKLSSDSKCPYRYFCSKFCYLSHKQDNKNNIVLQLWISHLINTKPWSPDNETGNLHVKLYMIRLVFFADSYRRAN